MLGAKGTTPDRTVEAGLSPASRNKVALAFLGCSCDRRGCLLAPVYSKDIAQSAEREQRDGHIKVGGKQKTCVSRRRTDRATFTSHYFFAPTPTA